MYSRTDGLGYGGDHTKCMNDTNAAIGYRQMRVASVGYTRSVSLRKVRAIPTQSEACEYYSYSLARLVAREITKSGVAVGVRSSGVICYSRI